MSIFDPEVFETKVYDDPLAQQGRKVRYVVDTIANLAVYRPAAKLASWWTDTVTSVTGAISRFMTRLTNIRQ